RIDAARNAVDARVVLLLRDLVVHEGLDLLRVYADHVDRGLVRGGRRPGEHRTVARVDRDDRAAVRGVGLVGDRRADPVAERLLGRALETHVDRQPHRLPRPRLARELERALRAPHRLHPDLRLPCVASQVLVLARLDAGLPDLVARLVDTRATVGLALRQLAARDPPLDRARAVRPRRRSAAPGRRAPGTGSDAGRSAGSGRPGTRARARRGTRPGPP